LVEEDDMAALVSRSGTLWNIGRRWWITPA
jgi:hypothetical protein